MSDAAFRIRGCIASTVMESRLAGTVGIAMRDSGWRI
jgi:hypothetical protein